MCQQKCLCNSYHILNRFTTHYINTVMRPKETTHRSDIKSVCHDISCVKYLVFSTDKMFQLCQHHFSLDIYIHLLNFQ